MGIIVEYAGRKGKPQWIKPKPFRWDYTQFGEANGAPASPDETIEITIVKHNGALNGFNQWTLNGEAFSMETMKPIYTVPVAPALDENIENEAVLVDGTPEPMLLPGEAGDDLIEVPFVRSAASLKRRAAARSTFGRDRRFESPSPSESPFKSISRYTPAVVISASAGTSTPYPL
jgi:hypothetical protein